MNGRYLSGKREQSSPGMKVTRRKEGLLDSLKNNVVLLCEQKLFTVISGVDDKKMREEAEQSVSEWR